MPASPQVIHVFDLLATPQVDELPPILALVGDDRFLKKLVIDHLLGVGDEADYVRHRGEGSSWSEIADDLATVSLFGPGPRRVVISEAEEFVTQYRGELERYAAAARGGGTLALDLQSLPSNTKLYRAIADHGWLIECREPELKRGNSKSPDVKRMQKWLAAWGEQRHRIKLDAAAVEHLSDLVGWEFGQLDQELAKLALFVQPGGRVEVALVQRVVGGWRTQTTWEMLDAAADGDAKSALRQLDQLLQAGDAPQALFGSIAWSLRRFAAATRLVEQQERRGDRIDLASALQQAGFRNWPKDALKRASQQLRQISRSRGGQLYQWLLETDLALKGSHSSPQRGRWALEHLIFRLADEARPATAQTPSAAKRRVR